MQNVSADTVPIMNRTISTVRCIVKIGRGKE